MHLHIQVIHTQALALRKRICDQMLDQLRASPLFQSVTCTFTDGQYEPDSFKSIDLSGMVSLEVIQDESLKMFNGAMKNLHVKQLSSVMKHYDAVAKLWKMAEVLGPRSDTFYMVVEDDVVFGQNLAERLHAALGGMPADADLMFLGLPTPQNAAPYNKISMPVLLPSCESYVLSHKALQSLHARYLPIKFVTTIQLSYLAVMLSLNLYAYAPTVFTDGSKYGIYISSIDANSKLSLNPEYAALSSLLTKDAPSEKDLQDAEALLQSVRFKNHPSIQYMTALMDIHKKRYQEAKNKCEEIMRNMVQNNCIINNETEFLKTYMYLNKYLQTDLPDDMAVV